jgi:hypothetical protein
VNQWEFQWHVDGELRGLEAGSRLVWIGRRNFRAGENKAEMNTSNQAAPSKVNFAIQLFFI